MPILGMPCVAESDSLVSTEGNSRMMLEFLGKGSGTGFLHKKPVPEKS